MLLGELGYALRKIISHRKALALWKKDPKRSVLRLVDLDPFDLHQSGIRVCVLDFDGVLASHGELEPLPEVKAWILEAIGVFGAPQIFILSNNPKTEREIFFRKHFGGIHFITPKHKKPHPQGLQEILKQTKVSAAQVLLIDDRLWTGMLSTVLAGVRGIWVKHPYQDFSKRPLQESFFFLLRFCEKTF